MIIPLKLLLHIALYSTWNRFHHIDEENSKTGPSEAVLMLKRALPPCSFHKLLSAEKTDSRETCTENGPSDPYSTLWNATLLLFIPSRSTLTWWASWGGGLEDERSESMARCAMALPPPKAMPWATMPPRPESIPPPPPPYCAGGGAAAA